MSTVTDLLSQAATLPPVELSELIRNLQALEATSGGPPLQKSSSTKDVYIYMLYDALSHYLQYHLHIRPIPAPVFLTKKLGKTVFDSLKDAVEQLHVLAPEMTRTEWASITYLVADLTVDHVKTGQFNVPWFGISLTLKNLPSLLDKHFPGYASSGLLKLLLRLRTQKRDTHG